MPLDCRVTLEAGVQVVDVAGTDEAVRVAISRVGEALNPDLSYVDIEPATRTTDDGEELPPAFVAADEALVALELSLTVFNAESEEHAERIARTDVGEQLGDVPLTVTAVEVVEERDGADEDADDDLPEFEDVIGV
jgi:uncharacterized protein (UPF0212 family)